jgi:conjugal transfer pilus assembly protein TraW
MKQKLLALLLLFFSLDLMGFGFKAHSADLGTHGHTYLIQEQDILEYIQQKLLSMQKSGELQTLQSNMKKKALKSINRPKPVNNIQYATENKQYIYDPTYILDKNIYHPNGKILFLKGTKVNPLDTVSLRQKLIFIDGDRESHIQFAIEEHNKEPQEHKKPKIILLKGSIIGLMKQRNIRLYFDQNGAIIKKLNIKNIPAIVEQQSKVLLIKEVALDE